MVESVRPGRLGQVPPVIRDNVREAEGRFTMETGAAPVSQNARLSRTPPIGLESMLLLQAVDEAVERDRRARKRGSAMVAALTDLQRAMLAEEDPALALRSLSELAATDPDAADPGLAAVLRAVVLRSRIEVARRERRGA